MNGFSIPAGTVSSATLLGNQFNINGNFVASDGSNQTFLVVGDALNQAVTITTSTGFTVSGAMTGGNVQIKQ